jgi:hypothetical protein
MIESRAARARARSAPGRSGTTDFGLSRRVCLLCGHCVAFSAGRFAGRSALGGSLRERESPPRCWGQIAPGFREHLDTNSACLTKAPTCGENVRRAAPAGRFHPFPRRPRPRPHHANARAERQRCTLLGPSEISDDQERLCALVRMTIAVRYLVARGGGDAARQHLQRARDRAAEHKPKQRASHVERAGSAGAEKAENSDGRDGEESDQHRVQPPPDGRPRRHRQ